MPRLFSGIEIPAAVARRLTLVRAGLNGARWIDPENYHVTLRFLGDVDGTTARDFAHGLGEIVGRSFELRLDALGSFGGRMSAPRALPVCRQNPETSRRTSPWLGFAAQAPTLLPPISSAKAAFRA